MNDTPQPTFEPHEPGTFVLQQGLRRLYIPAVVIALAFLGVGYALGRGGTAGLIIDGCVAISLLCLPLLDRTRLNPDNWMSGYFGEKMVAALLDMLPESFHTLHDITVASHGKKSNIDHIVVGPTGIWVIETKNWRGRFEQRGGDLFCNGVKRTYFLDQAVARATTVRRGLEVAGCGVGWINVLVVSTKARVPNGRIDFPRATLTGASDVLPLIRPGKHILTADTVHLVVSVLERGKHKGSFPIDAR
jgi:hypothetical protein